MSGGTAGVCDVTNNGRHFGFRQGLEIRVKQREMVIFLLDMKNNTWIGTLHDFSHKIYFYCRKKLKKHVLSLKNGFTTSYLWRHIS